MATPIPLTSLSTLREPVKPVEVEKDALPETDETTELIPEVKDTEQPTSSPPLCELAPTDRLIITRRLHVKPVLFLRGKRNRFYVRTPDQNLVYTIEEDSRWWVGYIWYGLRPMELKVTNSLGTEVMRIVRPFAMTTRILPCWLQRLQVFSPPGTKIGTVEQQWTAINPLYLVKDKNDEPVFWIRGPKCTLSCFNDVQFEIVRPDGGHVGATCKRWEGLMHALFLAPVTDRCGVAYEKDLSEEEKGLLLAVTILLDYMYYDV